MKFSPKAVLPLVAAAAAFAGVPDAAAAGPEERLNLLFFGNSFSMDSIPENVANLAIADGHTAPLVVTERLGGMDLDYHLGRVDSSPTTNVNHASIAGQTWDRVIIQEHSTKPTHIGNPADFRADAVALYNKVRNHASGRGAGASAVLYQTWARAQGNSFYPSNFASADAMQAELSTNYALAAEDILKAGGTADVAPVGDGFGAYDFNPSLYDADLYHPGPSGGLLASMILYRTIYHEKVSDIAYSSTQAWVQVNQATWNSLAATADALPIPTPEPGTAGLVGLSLPLVLRRPSQGQ